LGSVSYLSPEQVQRGVADARSDVYAVGIMAFEMLTGEKPFLGDSPIQIAYMHVTQEIPSLRTKRKEIPRELDELILQATNRNPDKRPSTAGDFLKSLESIQSEIDPKTNQMKLALDLPVEPIKEKQRGKVKREVKEEVEKVEEVKETTQEVRTTKEKKRKSSKRVRRNRKIALTLAIALGVGGWYTLIGPGSRVVVPSVVGATFRQAVSTLTPLGLTTVVLEKRFDEEITAGAIIESDPPGGGRVESGGEVKLIISKGPERYTIPALKGLTPKAAQAVIEKYPLLIGTSTEAFNMAIPKGFVISSEPPVGTKVKRDSQLSLVISKGVETLPLASYEGKSGEQALNELTDLGFNVESTYAFDENIFSGAVISQKPTGVDVAPKGSTITLIISKGSQYVFIPNVFSLDQIKATQVLADLQLKVVVKKLGVNKVKKVTSIVPKVGSKVKRGSTVTITVG
jgi:serine/threonine-protein kinase